MVAISLLFIYMSFLLCLDPMISQKDKSKSTATAANSTTATNANRAAAKHYERQVNDESQLDNPTQECVFSETVPPSTTAAGLQNHRQRSSTVLNIVTHGQSKWRKQVRRDFLFFVSDRSSSEYFRFNNNGKQSIQNMNC